MTGETFCESRYTQRGAAMSDGNAERRPASSRREVFNLCKSGEFATRDRYGLADVGYGEKMTKAQVQGMMRYLREERAIDGMEDLLTHRAMSAAAQVLCRWPRPSELARAIQGMNPGKRAKEAFYFSNTVKVKGSGIGRFIGKNGVNLYRLTEAADLLYIWVKPSPGRRDEHLIYMYASAGGRKKEGAEKMKAAEAIIKSAVRRSPHVELDERHSSKSMGIAIPFSEDGTEW